jgi:hypothetical protein
MSVSDVGIKRAMRAKLKKNLKSSLESLILKIEKF